MSRFAVVFTKKEALYFQLLLCDPDNGCVTNKSKGTRGSKGWGVELGALRGRP